VKVRIGISAGGESLGPDAMVDLGRAIAETGFDSLWLPEVLSRPGPDPLVGLAWVSGACPGLKIGTTMLLPGRNLVWLAKAVGSLDLLSGGRFLLTFVPGLAIGAERSAVGIPAAERAVLMDDALPVLRRLWAGDVVSHDPLCHCVVVKTGQGMLTVQDDYARFMQEYTQAKGLKVGAKVTGVYKVVSYINYMTSVAYAQ